MRTRLMVALALVLALVGQADAVYLQFSSTVAATSVNSTVTFVDNRSGGPGGSFLATRVRFRNAGPNTAFVDCQDATATTADLRIRIGDTLELVYEGPTRERTPAGFAQCGIITTAAETASVDVNAWRY